MHLEQCSAGPKYCGGPSHCAVHPGISVSTVESWGHTGAGGSETGILRFSVPAKRFLGSSVMMNTVGARSVPCAEVDRLRSGGVDTRCRGGRFAVGVCFAPPRLGQESNELNF